LKLTFAALICATERWRGLRFTEFELRELAALRKELDDEYEAGVRVDLTYSPRLGECPLCAQLPLGVELSRTHPCHLR